MSRNKKSRISTFGSQATSIVSLALTLLILGLLAFCIVAARNVTDNVRSSLTLTVKVSTSATPRQLNALKQEFRKDKSLASHTFISADQILAQELQAIGSDLDGILDENPYNAEFELHLKAPYANADSIRRIVRHLGENPAVEEVITDANVIHSVDRTLNKVTIIMLSVAAALLLISFVLINNTVSLSIYSRRFVIRTMKLVGATPSFIRRPFVRAGIGNGFIAGIIAAAILVGLREYAAHFDAELAEALPVEQTALVCGAVVVTGVIVCTIAAWAAATRYLRRNYDSLYRK